jgi:hypothetical protein
MIVELIVSEMSILLNFKVDIEEWILWGQNAGDI